MNQRTLFIINPAAAGGRGLQRWGVFQKRLLLTQSASPEVQITRESGEAERLAAKAASDYDLLVAVGGDGTAAEVANGLLRSGKARARLGLVPCGTGNDLARTAGVPTIEEALGALCAGTARNIDVIRITCSARGKAAPRYALAFAGVGIVGRVLRYATPQWKRVLGRSLAYRIALLKALWSYSPAQMSITSDGKRFDGSFLFLGLNNSEEAGGGLKLAPGARNDDGLLNVNLVGAVGKLEGLMELRRLARGTHTSHSKVSYFPSRDVRVEARESLEVAADGELIGHTPARFEVLPGALSMLTLRQ